ncbi:hypothetical protein ACS5PN_11925 [Roseateles sp. NT4]
MQVLTLTLERVFDIQRYESARHRPRTTHFSFEAGGRKHYGVRVAGWPRVQAGDNLTAVLRSADNWQTLAGWKNLSTGERVVPATGSVRHMAYLLAGAGFCYLVTSGATSSAARQVALGLQVVLGLALLAGGVEAWRSYRCRRLIERL